MTSFAAADSGSVTQPGATNFQQGGAATQVQPGADDNSVVLEYGGRQFTKAELLKKLTSGDQFIEQLKAERQEDRKVLTEATEALKRSVGAADVLKQLQAGQQPAAAAQQPAVQQPVVPDASAIAQQVMEQLKQGETAKARDANWSAVTTALTQAYGDKVNAKVAEVVAAADMTLEQGAELARSNPKLFLKLFPDLTPKAQPSALNSGGAVNSQSFQSQQRGPSGYAQAKNQREQVTIYLNRLKELGL